jgi:phosphatidylethanolamine/phosphatidyl-N-methylethanolamine N-methyltransferase
VLIRSSKRLKDSENLLFLKRLIKNPRSLGAIAPSSKALAHFICRHIDYKEGDYVIEIGAGTGSFTRAILNSGVPASKLIVVELDKELAQYLRLHFPTIQVIHGNATVLETLISPQVIGHVQTIVSGIPMVNIPKKIQKEIIDSCFRILGEGGGILQFTYGPVSPVSAASFGFFAQKLGRVLQNFPPATVWRYTLKPLVDGQLLKKKRDYMQRLLLKFQKSSRRVIK